MKKLLLIVLIALFVLTPVSVYAYNNQSEINFEWMPHFFMRESHQERMDEWIDEALQEGKISEEEAAWYREHHETMNENFRSRGFGCH